MNDFLSAIWPTYGYGELRTIKNGKVQQEFFELGAGDAAYAVTTSLEADMDGRDAYFGVLPRKQRGGKSEDCYPDTRILWADLDIKQRSRGDLLSSLTSFPITPSIIVDSGHGFHAYWLLAEAQPFGDARLVMQGIAKTIGGDHTHDAARVLRLPGTHNWKDPENPIPVRLLRLDTLTRYRFSDFDAYAELAGPSNATPRTWRAIRRDVSDDLPDWLTDLIANGPEPGADRSAQVFKTCVWLMRYGRGTQEIVQTMRDNPTGIGEKYYSKGERGDAWLAVTLRAAREAEGIPA